MNLPKDLQYFSKMLGELRKLPYLSSKNLYKVGVSILEMDYSAVEKLASVLTLAKQYSKKCLQCHAYSELDLCLICTNEKLSEKKICVVANWLEMLTVSTAVDFDGKFHVLGGLLSPLDGIGPNQLNIATLKERVKLKDVEEILFAFSPTPEAEVTISLIISTLKEFCEKIRFFRISSGVPVGASIEFSDRSTLTQAFAEKRALL